MRIGIVGLGGAGRVRFEPRKHVAGASVVAVCDDDPAVANGLDEGIRPYEDPRAIFEKGGLDAVSICTPPGTHAVLTIAALKCGLPVMCEKPLATTPISALSMLQAAARARKPLQLATKFRHVPGLQRARDLLRAGT